MRRYILKFSIAFLITAFFSNCLNAQEDFDMSKYKLLYKFSIEKQPDNSRILKVNFLARHKKNRKDKIPIYNAEIKFLNNGLNESVLLGKALTDKAGNAQLIIPETHQYLTDSEGYINFEGRHDKTSFLPKKSSKIQLKDIDLSMKLVEIDSIRTVLVNAYVKDSLGIPYTVDDLVIKISIGSMFSKMTIEEATLRNGQYKFKFPDDLKGQPDGSIVVYTSLEDHDDFGDVVQMEQADWGVARPIEKEKNHMLWTSAAPYWMYVVLTIMLVGVWANYGYTIYNLIKLKRENQVLEHLKTNN
jgi:hypothetical protein